MTQIGEAIAFSGDGSGNMKLYKCKWSSCKGKHMQKPKYPDDGKTTKGGYRADWISKKMQPWEVYGEDRKRLTKDGEEEANVYEYETQAHHLVPTTLVNKTGTLKANLKLIGYKCDGRENGMILPKTETDIPIHDLQAHRGNHPGGYMNPLKKSIAQIEKDFDGICNSDLLGIMGPQRGVIVEMAMLSGTAKTKIENIKTGAKFWPLRSNALAEFNDAHAEYDRRLQLHKSK